MAKFPVPVKIFSSANSYIGKSLLIHVHLYKDSSQHMETLVHQYLTSSKYLSSGSLPDNI